MSSTEHSSMAPANNHKIWTSRLPNSTHVQIFKDADWAATDLGPLEDWGPALQFAANMVFADSRGACIYWGPQRIAFYNEAFMPMAGAAHPHLMGKPFAVGFPELATGISPIFDKAEAEGTTVDVENIPLFVQRNGYLEETYFIGQFIPLRGDNGQVGFYNTCYESTFRVVHDRRRIVLDRITALPTSSVSSVFDHLVGALQSDEQDISMMLIYSADETVAGTCQMTLRGSIGVPVGHKLAPASGDLHQSKDGLFPLFRKARHQEAPLLIQTGDESFREARASLLDGIQWVGFGEQPQEIVVSPLGSATKVFGFLVLGTNPRRKYDTTCHQFHGDIIQQLLAKLNSAVSIEEAQVKEESLLRDLADSERRIRSMATYAPVGMISLDMAGNLLWANKQYYDILGSSKEDTSDLESLLGFYHDEDLAQTQEMWAELMQGAASLSSELRLKRLFLAPDGGTEHAWVLVHGFCLKEEGEVKYIMGCLTDISRLKWAESVQSRSAAAAQDAKRRQEEFIDLTSHELRNPLGAILICAETIARSLDDLETSQAPKLLELIRDNIHTAETILACAGHQKRIIDDVLLLSRLESQMLSIAPIQTNIETLVKDAERMFSGECKQHDISLVINRHQSITDSQVDTVMCDPSRLMQIIINVVANSIKFVRPEPERDISITYGAADSVHQVYAFNSAVRWCPSLERRNDDPTEAPEWGEGRPLYMFFSVRDSGPGLDPQDVDHLFQRFAQTTKLTHVHYGGSGLGLYISRELAEKQGGEIGIASQKGAGATFTFYIKTRRAINKPTESLPLRRQQQHTRPLSPNAERSAKKATSNKTKLHVLLVEDNLVNQKFLARGLERNGYTVHIANHGLEAIDTLKRTNGWKVAADETIPNDTITNGVPLVSHLQVDLILMDWEMPILDGLTASKRIREYEKEKSIARRTTIIGITANARREQIQVALDVGMDDVLPKPFLVSEMVAKVEEWREKIVASGTNG